MPVQFQPPTGGLGGRFRPGLVTSDPRGGQLKKSRRNRGALHGDFHGGEADVVANYALPFHFDCVRFLAAFPGLQRPVKDGDSKASKIRFVEECGVSSILDSRSRSHSKDTEWLDIWVMPRDRPRHD